MNDPILEDVQEQIEAFTVRVRDTFDVRRYPHMADSARFDIAVGATEDALERLKIVFNDYLATCWAAEAAAALGVPRTGDRTPHPRKPS